jgi:hypothetical protein
LDVIVEQEPLIVGLESLEEAVGSFFHLCFVAHLEYPKGSGVLSTVLQRFVAKLDENGTKAALLGKDLRNKADKGRAFTRSFAAYLNNTKEGKK